MKNSNYPLSSKNIMRIDFHYEIGEINISKTILFNQTRISEAEVRELIINDLYEYDDRLVLLSSRQLKNLTDKEVI